MKVIVMLENYVEEIQILHAHFLPDLLSARSFPPFSNFVIYRIYYLALSASKISLLFLILFDFLSDLYLTISERRVQGQRR